MLNQYNQHHPLGKATHSVILVSRAYSWTLAVSVLAVTTAHCIAAARVLFIVFRCASCPKGLYPFGSSSFGRLYLLSLQVAKPCGSLSVPSVPSRGRVVGRSQLLNPSGVGSSRLACSTSAALLMCLALVSLKDLDGRVGTSYVLRQESRTMSRSTSQTYDAFPYLQHAPNFAVIDTRARRAL